jgi:2-dehydro-3-deoxy-L-rhamnonate dehydrogenase (NAD+)
MRGVEGLRGQRIVVVGAASGIGRGVAEHLAARGSELVLLDRDIHGCDRLAERLRADGATVHAGPIDLADPDSVLRAIDSCVAQLGVPHGLVNSAGIPGPTGLPSHEMAIEDFDAVLGVNLRGAFLLSRAILPHLVAAEYGRIVHLASIAGKDGNPNMIGYSTSKAGLIGMVKAQGKEYAGTGVTINAVAPAVIMTDFVRQLPQETIDYMTERIPMGRCGEVEEVAELVAWAVSPACSFTTGFTFDATGGRATY